MRRRETRSKRAFPDVPCGDVASFTATGNSCDKAGLSPSGRRRLQCLQSGRPRTVLLGLLLMPLQRVHPGQMLLHLGILRADRGGALCGRQGLRQLAGLQTGQAEQVPVFGVESRLDERLE